MRSWIKALTRSIARFLTRKRRARVESAMTLHSSDPQPTEVVVPPVQPDTVAGPHVSSNGGGETTPDLNEQLRACVRELQSVAEIYIIEDGRVFLRSSIPKV